ncbi:class I SAM-dependent methyltransferase [Bengtsoniella intestinalis]|uniref:tRNA (adenine(22)-N(1))-methyltransferase n=1 Tax=Bengtsoniella intestinalis TaxID=3073143 RepID=UPI00391F6065
MTNLELSPRLHLIADWVPQGARLVDVGTDHAYLPVWLLVHGKIDRAIASDLRKGPLERARQTGRIHGVEEKISFRLCGGLDATKVHEVDTVAIAGMGGETIAQILQAAPWTKEPQMRLLLQPMSRSETLRQYLADNGYCITREQLVADRGVVYPVLEVMAGEMKLTLGQVYCGYLLQKDPLAERYIIEKILQLQQIIAQRKGRAPQQAVDALRDVVASLLELREEWRHGNTT